MYFPPPIRTPSECFISSQCELSKYYSGFKWTVKRKKGDVEKKKWKLNRQQDRAGHTSKIRVGKYSRAGLGGGGKGMSWRHYLNF